jgi:hypothetical protein
MKEADLLALRSWGAQNVIVGSEQDGLKSLQQYSGLMASRFLDVLNRHVDHEVLAGVAEARRLNASVIPSNTSHSAADAEETLLSMLLGEAFGGIRVYPKLNEAFLSPSALGTVDASMHFRLGVGLAKLGMYDLSVKHVSLSATPWEAPLYRLRSQLQFPPTHASLRTLAQAVDVFESQCESILLFKSHKALLMSSVCNSLDDAALALQALPLLHLAGYSAPRETLNLGHSPVGLQRLLGEVYTTMCPLAPLAPVLPLPLGRDVAGDGTAAREAAGEPAVIEAEEAGASSAPASSSGASVDVAMKAASAEEAAATAREGMSARDEEVFKKRTRARLGVVSGSFDGIAGRLIVGARVILQPPKDIGTPTLT